MLPDLSGLPLILFFAALGLLLLVVELGRLAWFVYAHIQIIWG